MRWLRHVFAPSARKLFPPARMDRIAAAIAAGERRHGGEVMFAIEEELPLAALWRGTSPRERARHAFAVLRTWDTRANNGVLIYLLLADHAIEIVADRGLDGKVTAAQWHEVCQRMRERMRAGDPEQAAIGGIEAVSELLAEHFPPGPDTPEENELPNRPQVLG